MCERVGMSYAIEIDVGTTNEGRPRGLRWRDRSVERVGGHSADDSSARTRPRGSLTRRRDHQRSPSSCSSNRAQGPVHASPRRPPRRRSQRLLLSPRPTARPTSHRRAHRPGLAGLALELDRSGRLDPASWPPSAKRPRPPARPPSPVVSLTAAAARPRPPQPPPWAKPSSRRPAPAGFFRPAVVSACTP